MKESDRSGKRWFLQIQSTYVLPLARGIYLLIALACLLTVIGGVIFAVYLQTSIARQPSTVPVPTPYQGTATVGDTSAPEVDLAVIGNRLEPPTNIRFVVTARTITKPPVEGTVLGHFIADTPNMLAPFPEGVSILGGRDAELFERIRDPAQERIGLAARAALAAEIAEALLDIKEQTSQTFEVRVVARDKYGMTSVPTDLSFALKLGPALASPAAPVPEAQAEPQPEPTELQTIAREIARIVEPEVNPDHFAAYKTAVKVPGRCGTSDDDETFVSNYRRALEGMRPRLSASNVEAFYAGLCEAWKGVLEREAAERERAEQKQYAARRVADEARARAQAHNAQVLQEHSARVLDAKAQTAVAMSVIGGALAIFLLIALVLAFLAIEGHSRAVRAAMESMVRMTEERKTNEPVADGP